MPSNGTEHDALALAYEYLSEVHERLAAILRDDT
jgi:hypothetical protein